MDKTATVSSSREQLLDDFNKVVTDTETLLRSLSSASGEKAIALRESVEENLRSAKARLVLLRAQATERTTAAARATDTYVHDNPWTSIGLAAAVGVIIGLVISGRR